MWVVSKIITLFVLTILLQGCNQKETNKTLASSYEKSSQEMSKNDFNVDEQDHWADYLNNRSEKLGNLYSEDAYKVLNDGEVIKGSDHIADYLFNSEIRVSSISTDTLIQANEQRGLSYELRSIEDGDANKYKSIIIWESTDSGRLRVFEFTTNVLAEKYNLTEVNKRREEWIQICNSHNASKLVKELYSENTLYFNHKPMVVGRQNLIPEYAYMNREDYQLSLDPIFVEQVNDKIVFDIGQCKGSYNGKYILIWKKNELGNWEVFIDSNI